jgi:hypothetical protein
MGLGTVFPILFWLMAAATAYFADDRRTHHVMNVL